MLFVLHFRWTRGVSKTRPSSVMNNHISYWWTLFEFRDNVLKKILACLIESHSGNTEKALIRENIFLIHLRFCNCWIMLLCLKPGSCGWQNRPLPSGPPGYLPLPDRFKKMTSAGYSLRCVTGLKLQGDLFLNPMWIIIYNSLKIWEYNPRMYCTFLHVEYWWKMSFFYFFIFIFD